MLEGMYFGGSEELMFGGVREVGRESREGEGKREEGR